MKTKQKKDRQFINDFLFRKVKLGMGMDYPENWEDIITLGIMKTSTKLGFTVNDNKIIFDGIEGDFSTDNYNGVFIKLEDCGRDELLAILNSNPYYANDAIQSYMNDWFDADWNDFDGNYDGLIRSVLDSNDGSVNTGNLKFYFK